MKRCRFASERRGGSYAHSGEDEQNGHEEDGNEESGGKEKVDNESVDNAKRKHSTEHST
jgi:hypothetical protein